MKPFLQSRSSLTMLICRLLAASAAAFALAACQSSRPAAAPPPPPVQPVYVPPPVRSAPSQSNAPNVQPAQLVQPVQPAAAAAVPVQPAPPSLARQIITSDKRSLSQEQMIVSLAGTRFFILGEQDNNDPHQWLSGWFVEQLAARGQLAALALGMLEGVGERVQLPRNASPAQVRDTLQWQQRTIGYPFERYERVVMAAVRAGVPLVPANLQRANLASVQNDSSLDGAISPSARGWMTKHIIDASCGLLKSNNTAQLTALSRVQIAQDRAMAQALRQNLTANKTVMLLASTLHADRGIGVPQHLGNPSLLTVIMDEARADGGAPSQNADLVWVTQPSAPGNRCAGARDGLIKPGRPLQIR
jgi:uncharacterized iron-regulated protein